MQRSNWLLSHFKVILRMTSSWLHSSPCYEFLTLRLFTFSYLFTFTFSITHFPLACSFCPTFLSHLSEMSFYSICNLPSTNAVEILDYDDIQSVHKSLSKTATHRSPYSLLRSAKESTRRSSSPLTRSKVPTVLFTRSQTPLQRAVRGHTQAWLRLQTWDNDYFFFVCCQRSGCHRGPSTCFRRWSRVGKDISTLNIPNGPYWHPAVDIWGETYKHLWNAGHLCMPILMSEDGADIQQAGALSLSKIRNTFSTLGCHDETFDGPMNSSARKQPKWDRFSSPSCV